jgi:hypothetical protein
MSRDRPALISGSHREALGRFGMRPHKSVSSAFSIGVLIALFAVAAVGEDLDGKNVNCQANESVLVGFKPDGSRLVPKLNPVDGEAFSILIKRPHAEVQEFFGSAPGLPPKDPYTVERVGADVWVLRPDGAGGKHQTLMLTRKEASLALLVSQHEPEPGSPSVRVVLAKCSIKK